MKKFLPFILVSLLTFNLQGCSSKETTSTQTVTEESVPNSEVIEADRHSKKVIVTETKTEVKEDGPYCRGILGCTFEVTGDIIAFPFRLVGGLIDLIF